jgi:hypothetical protein
LLDAAMKAGPYKTKKDAVEAGLKLLARRAAYREILKWKGKLKWEGDDDIDWTQPRQDVDEPDAASSTGVIADEPAAVAERRGVYEPADKAKVPVKTKAEAKAVPRARR